MTIPIPTIDDFDTSTVMTSMREVVDYLIGMVPQINSGDITDLQTSYTNNILTITLVKGDGTTIPKNVTIQGGSGTESPYPTDVALSLSGTTLNFNMAMSNGTPITGSVNLATFATDAEVQSIKSDLQGQITGIKPTVTVDENVSPPTISVAVNGTTSTTNLPVGGGNIIEELDVNNLPNDFNDGDVLIVNAKMYASNTNPSSWSGSITTPEIKTRNTPTFCFIGEIPKSANTSRQLVQTGSNVNNILIGAIAIYPVNNWNNSNEGTALFAFYCNAFNANGNASTLKVIIRSELQNYIYSIYRIKKPGS